jgi:uncharacterized protein involved in exopolysaccharide biosynthesis
MPGRRPINQPSESEKIMVPTEIELNFPRHGRENEAGSSESEPLGPGLLDLLVIAASRKWSIVGMTCAGGLIAALVALLLPAVYTSTAVIMAPQQQQSAASSLLGQLGPVASLAGRDLGLKTPADLYIGILSGRTIADQLIGAFQLRKRYAVRTTEEARKILGKRTHFSTGKDSLIRIAVDDRDPKDAAALANAYVSALHQQNDRLAITESAERRLFFEKQLEKEKNALADSEAAMRATQERTGVLQVNSQVEATMRALVQLRAEITTREVALTTIKGAATAENPVVVRQETELDALRAQLKTLESKAGPGLSFDPIISTTELPRVGLEYVRAVRDVKYHETLFELLSKQYEVARIDEAKEAPVIQVVDTAVPPEKKSWPPRILLTIAGAVCFGLLACLWAFVSHRFREPANAQKLRLLRGTLFGKAA